MNHNCVMPQNSIPRPEYYERYVKYMVNILLENSVNIEYVGINVDAIYSMEVDGQKIIIDYSDHPHLDVSKLACKAYFKFHYRKEHKEFKNVFPFAPTSFYDWKQLRKLRNQITYKCNNDLVLNVQKPYGNAIERRKHVRDLLYGKYKAGNNFDIFTRLHPSKLLEIDE